MPGHVQHILSTYLSVPGDRRVFRPRHDQNVALWRISDSVIELQRVWEVERFSGEKHHQAPMYSVGRAESFLALLLAQEELTVEDISQTWGTPNLPKYEESVRPSGTNAFYIHTLAHLYSGVLSDSSLFQNEQVYGLAMDGAPDRVLDDKKALSRYVGSVSSAGQIDYFQIESPGRLYDSASSLFKREPGTLMALATATPAAMTYDPLAFWETNWLSGRALPPRQVATTFMEGLLAEARTQQSSWRPMEQLGFSLDDLLVSAVMKMVQTACSHIARRNIELLRDRTGVDPSDCHLALSGGYALNCPGNTDLIDYFGFKSLLSPPCVNDTGQAVGIGLMNFYARGYLASRTFKFPYAYCGPSQINIPAALTQFDEYVVSNVPYSADQFVTDVTTQPVAWISGNEELGPRALGHRSFFADPRHIDSKNQLNVIKRRQWWRPVAPIVLAEHAREWFGISRPSPYMLETANIVPARRESVPAISHLDGTARLQTIAMSDDLFLHSVIEDFRIRTGVPMLCNTSLNDIGEPIIASASQAINLCLRRGVQVAYIDGRRIELRKPVKFSEQLLHPEPRSFRFFAGEDLQRSALWASWPEMLTEDAKHLIAYQPELEKLLSTPAGVLQVNTMAATASRDVLRNNEL